MLPGYPLASIPHRAHPLYEVGCLPVDRGEHEVVGLDVCPLLETCEQLMEAPRARHDVRDIRLGRDPFPPPAHAQRDERRVEHVDDLRAVGLAGTSVDQVRQGAGVVHKVDDTTPCEWLRRRVELATAAHSSPTPM